jgi:transposase InsO family protein
MARAYYARFGIVIRRVLTDNGSCYRHRRFRGILAQAFGLAVGAGGIGPGEAVLEMKLHHRPARPPRRIGSRQVIEVLADAMVEHGIPEHVRSDNGPEFVARGLRNWLAATGAKTLYIEPGSPWENGYCESFNSKLRDEFLNGEIFYTLKEAQVLAERWRVYYNTERPHSSPGYRPPAPAAWKAGTNTGHGEVETAARFPLLHTPDGDGLTNSSAALH